MTNPRLPPLLVNKASSVFTCIPTKMFGTEISSGAKEESQKIGKVLGGQKDGVICFNGVFFRSVQNLETSW